VIIMTTRNTEQFDSINYRIPPSSVGGTEKHRSLSERIRDLFKTSQSDVRVDNTSSSTSLNKKRKNPSSLPPPSSSSQNINQTNPPQLKVPTMNWPFKQNKNKKNKKPNKRTKQKQQDIIEISSPINVEHYQHPQGAYTGNNSLSKIYGQTYIQNSPDLQTRIQDNNSTNIYRGYAELDNTHNDTHKK
ncbi:unnamed protein product, partial [Didymodactylos carnosus]